MTDAPKTEDTMVAALLRERAGLKQRGKDERVTQVDEQLRLRGYSPDGERIHTEPDADDSVGLTPPATPQTPEVKNTQAPKGRQQRGTEKT